jgi:hypothetical protein
MQCSGGDAEPHRAGNPEKCASGKAMNCQHAGLAHDERYAEACLLPASAVPK